MGKERASGGILAENVEIGVVEPAETAVPEEENIASMVSGSAMKG